LSLLLLLLLLLQMCAEALLAYAAEAHNVRFLPGRVCDGQANGVRLSFAFYTPPELQEGARRLGAAIAAFAAQHAA
jgi:DNA-binding transcriptional MocR family regulator